jgi:hypothetical protein
MNSWWRYVSKNSYVRDEMEMSGKLPSSAALPLLSRNPDKYYLGILQAV